MLDKEEWDRRLACLVEAEMETTVPEDESSHDQSLKMIDALVFRADEEHPTKLGEYDVASGPVRDVDHVRPLNPYGCLRRRRPNYP